MKQLCTTSDWLALGIARAIMNDPSILAEAIRIAANGKGGGASPSRPRNHAEEIEIARREFAK